MCQCKCSKMIMISEEEYNTLLQDIEKYKQLALNGTTLAENAIEAQRRALWQAGISVKVT